MNEILKLLGAKHEMKMRRNDEDNGFVVQITNARGFVANWSFTDFEVISFRGDILSAAVKNCIYVLEGREKDEEVKNE